MEDIALLRSLAPYVAECMKSFGCLKPWIQFHQMVSEGTFPMNNICFQLFLDVVRFFGTQSTIEMRYSNEVKRFWMTGFRLFHGRFLRFMGGPKNAGQLIKGVQKEVGTIRLKQTSTLLFHQQNAFKVLPSHNRNKCALVFVKIH